MAAVEVKASSETGVGYGCPWWQSEAQYDQRQLTSTEIGRHIEQEKATSVEADDDLSGDVADLPAKLDCERDVKMTYIAPSEPSPRELHNSPGDMAKQENVKMTLARELEDLWRTFVKKIDAKKDMVNVISECRMRFSKTLSEMLLLSTEDEKLANSSAEEKSSWSSLTTTFASYFGTAVCDMQSIRQMQDDSCNTLSEAAKELDSFSRMLQRVVNDSTGDVGMQAKEIDDNAKPSLQQLQKLFAKIAAVAKYVKFEKRACQMLDLDVLTTSVKDHDATMVMANYKIRILQKADMDLKLLRLVVGKIMAYLADEEKSSLSSFRTIASMLRTLGDFLGQQTEDASLSDFGGLRTMDDVQAMPGRHETNVFVKNEKFVDGLIRLEEKVSALKASALEKTAEVLLQLQKAARAVSRGTPLQRQV